MWLIKVICTCLSQVSCGRHLFKLSLVQDWLHSIQVRVGSGMQMKSQSFEVGSYKVRKLWKKCVEVVAGAMCSCDIAGCARRRRRSVHRGRDAPAYVTTPHPAPRAAPQPRRTKHEGPRFYRPLDFKYTLDWSFLR